MIFFLKQNGNSKMNGKSVKPFSIPFPNTIYPFSSRNRKIPKVNKTVIRNETIRDFTVLFSSLIICMRWAKTRCAYPWSIHSTSRTLHPTGQVQLNALDQIGMAMGNSPPKKKSPQGSTRMLAGDISSPFPFLTEINLRRGSPSPLVVEIRIPLLLM
jgi:hypothetical protein